MFGAPKPASTNLNAALFYFAGTQTQHLFQQVRLWIPKSNSLRVHLKRPAVRPQALQQDRQKKRTHWRSEQQQQQLSDPLS